MIQKGTVLKAADNSGVKLLNVINIPGYSRRRYASLGDVVTCSVRGASSTGTVKDHQIVDAVIVRTRKEVRRKDGSYLRFDDNAAVVVDKEKRPRGTRIFGPVARELRDSGFIKIVNLAPEVW
ncbi:50S ribosomal protein L14 [candidate division WWE3 bacterium RIFCSPLOWO2_01_FULL_42_11]|uniref:Large ribosomal subunit protein uL14 n=1 Tax=candidate division WWE3 bacterium RIFCSPLOWO2_01_FULL_42_11 TaxID=1802627 RepID=A0A1F4VRU1_UNCKA|nr:MAG: 50S ribosomal protein L14 [candidate division WWE3 bacterium RIFCSPLOWO2_01_FULL_42_11]